jgi:hypothetical protein
MISPTKIDFRHRRVRELSDVTDLLAVIFPGNPNLQHAAGRILLALRDADAPISSMAFLEREYRISRRSLQRARAKLARVGLIEHLSPLNRSHPGDHGWQLSTRMTGALRALTNFQSWHRDNDPLRSRKDAALLELLPRPDETPDSAAPRTPPDKPEWLD